MHDIAARIRGLAGRARAAAARHRLDWRHGAATAAVLLTGVAVMGLARGAPAEADIDPGQRLKIEVVQPVEPLFTAGPVMDVGVLVDSFEPRMLQASMPADPEPTFIDPYVEEAAPKEPAGFFRRFSSAIQQALPREDRAPPPQIRREDRSYGFNAPRPDWEAEREARRAWRERIEAERRAEREDRDRMEAERYERQRMRPPVDNGPYVKPYVEGPVG